MTNVDSRAPWILSSSSSRSSHSKLNFADLEGGSQDINCSNDTAALILSFTLGFMPPSLAATQYMHWGTHCTARHCHRDVKFGATLVRLVQKIQTVTLCPANRQGQVVPFQQQPHFSLLQSGSLSTRKTCRAACSAA